MISGSPLASLQGTQDARHYAGPEPESWNAENTNRAALEWVYTTSAQNEDDQFLYISNARKKHGIQSLQQFKMHCQLAISKLIHRK